METHNMMQEAAIKTQQEEMEECIALEENPEMYTMAWALVYANGEQAVIEASIKHKQAVAAVPGATVNLKIVVVNDNVAANMNL